MTPPTLAFLGGNGHASARLDGVRRVRTHGEGPFRLVEINYPGFDGRPRATSFDAFLASVDGQLAQSGARVGYASGIAALFVLALRARRLARDVRFVFQGPVLWGLERRWMPRLLRLLPASAVLRTAFGSTLYQRRFAHKQFTRPLDEKERAAFFAGYARCTALGDFFDWLTPAFLRELEAAFATDAAALADIDVWWGEKDHVVQADELALTQAALSVAWPLRTFAAWGHYPMIDDPAGWVREVTSYLESRPPPGP